MSALTTITNKASFVCGRTSLKLQKAAPKIFLGLGIVGFVGTVIEASRASLKVEEIVNERMQTLETIRKEEKRELERYSKEDATRDKVIIYTKLAVDLAKLYGPSFALGSVSIGCFLYSYKILNGRYLAAVTAYNGLSEIFKTYRKRVIDTEGLDRDEYYRYGTVSKSVVKEIINEKGEKEQVTEIVKENDPNKPGDGAVFFDETSKEWDRLPSMNKYFLQGLENMFTDKLRSKGHIFLNEVYDALGLPDTQEGQYIGWLLGAGDDYVDFGLFRNTEGNRRFINGETNIILLDFNHDGIIVNRI